MSLGGQTEVSEAKRSKKMLGLVGQVFDQLSNGEEVTFVLVAREKRGPSRVAVSTDTLAEARHLLQLALLDLDNLEATQASLLGNDLED